ncbi:MAG: trimethylamine methyltransferase family protein [Actinomycetota bacterium]|nr:trimethylamine methyltransferase family protein [Actinomycetota bacterium]
MTMKGFIVRNPVSVLSPDELERVHGAMLEVLRETGVVFEHPKALDVLADAGCRVDREKMLVKFPPYLVEDSLRRCPSRVTLKARNPKYDVDIGGNRMYFCPWVAMNLYDADTGERRAPREEDVLQAATVLDYLDEVHVYGFGNFANVDESVAPGLCAYPWGMAFNLRHTEKALFGAAILGIEPWIVEMFQAAGVRPGMLVSGAPPLTWPGHQLLVVFAAAEADFPIMPFCGMAAGSNSPATLAGTLVQNYAEMSAMITLAQSLKPGMEVLAGDYSQLMGMREAVVVQGGPEAALLDAAWSQIWRRHDIPRTGFNTRTDAKVIDYQGAAEKTLTLLLSVLSGSNKIYFHGGVYDELLASPVAAVMDNDVAKMVMRIVEGIKVTEDTLAVDVIDKVGPMPGHFLSEKHTREWWMKEQLLPEVADRSSYERWLAEGKKDFLARAKDRCAEIAKTHEVPPLPDDVDRELEKIYRSAKKTIQSWGL